MSSRFGTTLCLLGGLALPAWSDEPTNTMASCADTNNIQWYTPDRFTQAREAAGKQKRLLMIKGIAFGIDAVGAKCATKGCW